MPNFLLGGALFVLGCVSLWDAYGIASRQRRPGVFDSLGPDRYLMTVAVMLLIVGLCVNVQEARRAPPPVSRHAQRSNAEAARAHLWLLAAMCSYIGAIAVVGYALATFAFFALAFWIMGLRSWRWNVASSVALATAFVLLFQYLADMPLPKGAFGAG